jgi:hypothetical protein
MADEKAYDDHIQHGIDDDPNNDPAKGAVIGGVGGAAVGAAAGSMLGPGGAVIGGMIGGAVGAAASGAAVGAIDDHDNDDKMTGIGEGVDFDGDQTDEDDDILAASYPAGTAGGTATYPTGDPAGYTIDDNTTRPIR